MYVILIGILPYLPFPTEEEARYTISLFLVLRQSVCHFRTNETLDVSVCSRHGHCAVQDGNHTLFHYPKTCSSSAVVDIHRIQSPVARYIKNNPAPPLIRQIKANNKVSLLQTESIVTLSNFIFRPIFFALRLSGYIFLMSYFS